MPIPNIGAILASNVQIGGDAIENAVAKAYLAKHMNDFDRVKLNVGMGNGITLPWNAPAWVQKSATAGTQSRADMVLYVGNTATIVEVKGRIYPAVMGQLLAYWHLLTASNASLLQVYKVAAGETIQDGIAPILHTYGVEVELFPGAYVPPPANP
jgi:hypothetical protein